MLTGLVLFGLTACSDEGLFAPENIGTVAVDLDISGTPAEDPNQGCFLVRWENTDGPGQGQSCAPLDFLPKEFFQVPNGPTMVLLLEVPSNCTAVGVTTKTINVPRQGTADVTFEAACT